MAQKSSHGLVIYRGKYKIYLNKSFDFTQGNGWFSHVYGDDSYEIGFGFHKNNKFTAVRKAIKNYEHNVDNS